MKAINPKVWGASGWSLLHRMSFCFKNAKDAIEFYKTLQYLLPCPSCRKNLEDHFVNLPIPTKSADFPEWLWRLHTRVNYLIDKNNVDAITFQEVRNKYIYTCHKIESCEYTFLLAIAETHPGSKNINNNYLYALKKFIKTFIQYSFKDSIKPDIPNEIFDSRYKLRTWIHKITHTSKDFTEFKECKA